MLHTVKVILGGLVLLAVCLLVARAIGGPAPATAVATSTKAFLPIWLVAAGINMWLGVRKAGYSVREELPFFAIVFAVPAAAALLVLWRLTRG
jgi:hypothetical protein